MVDVDEDCCGVFFFIDQGVGVQPWVVGLRNWWEQVTSRLGFAVLHYVVKVDVDVWDIHYHGEDSQQQNGKRMQVESIF